MMTDACVDVARIVAIRSGLRTRSCNRVGRVDAARTRTIQTSRLVVSAAPVVPPYLHTCDDPRMR